MTRLVKSATEFGTSMQYKSVFESEYEKLFGGIIKKFDNLGVLEQDNTKADKYAGPWKDTLKSDDELKKIFVAGGPLTIKSAENYYNFYNMVIDDIKDYSRQNEKDINTLTKEIQSAGKDIPKYLASAQLHIEKDARSEDLAKHYTNQINVLVDLTEYPLKQLTQFTRACISYNTFFLKGYTNALNQIGNSLNKNKEN